MIALGGMIAVLLIGAGGLALTFSPEKLATPMVDVGSLPAARPPKAMSISKIATGTYENSAMFAFRGGARRDVRQFAATAVLVRHPKGNILIDTGFGQHVDQQLKLLPFYQQSAHHRKATALDTLAQERLRPSDVAAIIPTHTHWDHISGLTDLTSVPVLVSDAGRQFIASRASGTEVINSIPAVNYRSYRFADRPYLGFPHSHDLWGDGSIVIVPAPGHTPDSVAVFVALPTGKRFAFVGDVVWQLEGLEIPAEKPWMLRWMIGENRPETNLDIARIRAAVRRFPELRAIPAHDVRAFLTIPHFPKSMS